MIRNEKGITMVSLIVAIILMMIIASTIVFNIGNSSKISAYNKMQEDIKNLDAKLAVYYSVNKNLPIKEEKYEQIDNIKLINESDNDNYYVIDLSKLENLTINYGKDYSRYDEDKTVQDVYVVNEKTHNIYYIKGIEFEEKMFYSIKSNNVQIEVPEWSNVYIETSQFKDLNGDIAYIPAGFQVSLKKGENVISDGLVIKNVTDNNEFVWIPTKYAEFKRDIFSKNTWDNTQLKGEYDEISKSYKILDSNSNEDYYYEMMDEEEYNSVLEFGGFYVGRYETGIEEGELIALTNSSFEESWTGYVGGNAVIKKDATIWNYITHKKAKEVANRLYTKDENNVNSKLCSSYAWDTVLKFIEINNLEYGVESKSGVYEQESVKKSGTQKPANNIFDLAGNVEEWTLEQYSEQTRRVSRGGSFKDKVEEAPAATRNINGKLYVGEDMGFRIALYL